MSEHVSMELSALPGGATLTTLRGARSGPTVALLGGVHGDEDEGVLAVLRVVDQLADVPLAGTLRAVAPANAAAWGAQSRTSPLDGGNLARCFPGDRGGGPTSALAAAITEEVIRGADLLIDLHSAGVRCTMPLFCGFARDSQAAEASRRAAVAFGVPLIWEHPHTPPGRTLSVARDFGIPAIYAECAGGGGIAGVDLDAYVRGVRSVLAHVGLAPPSAAADSVADQSLVYGGGDTDAGVPSAHHGFFVTATHAGAVVAEGAEVGRIYDFEGHLLGAVRAPQEGRVMLLRRQARVHASDVLFVLARLEDAGN